jgi:hypothetical protein
MAKVELRAASALPKYSARDLLFSIAILFSLVGEVAAVLVGSSVLVVLFFLTTLLLGIAMWD